MSIIPPITVPTTWSDGQVLFSAALNGNFQALLNWINSNGRTAIVSDMTLFVAPGGGGNGLTPTSPLGSITAAYNLLQDQYAFFNTAAVVTIQVAPGSYNESVSLSGSIPGQQNPSNVVISGSVGSPSTVAISGTPTFTANHGTMVIIQGFQIASPGGDGIFGRHYSLIGFQAIDFVACSHNQVQAFDSAIIEAIGNYSISGDPGISHGRANGTGSHVYLSFQTNPNTSPGAGPLITLNGSRTFSGGFVSAVRCANVTLSGVQFSTTTATGPQYSVVDNAVIFTNTSGALVLPGNAGGTTVRGGVYD
jgi:hypothetical protein